MAVDHVETFEQAGSQPGAQLTRAALLKDADLTSYNRGVESRPLCGLLPDHQDDSNDLFQPHNARLYSALATPLTSAITGFRLENLARSAQYEGNALTGSELRGLRNGIAVGALTVVAAGVEDACLFNKTPYSTASKIGDMLGMPLAGLLISNPYLRVIGMVTAHTIGRAIDAYLNPPVPNPSDQMRR